MQIFSVFNVMWKTFASKHMSICEKHGVIILIIQTAEETYCKTQILDIFPYICITSPPTLNITIL